MSFKRGKRPATCLLELQELEDEFNKEVSKLRRGWKEGFYTEREFELIHEASISAWVLNVNFILLNCQHPPYPPFYRLVARVGVEVAAEILRLKGGYLNDFQTPTR